MRQRLQPSLLLFRGRGIVSTLIGWQTRGPYSHSTLLLPSGEIVEAWQGAGVRIKRLSDWSGVDRFVIPSMTDEGWEKALDFAISQVGRGYDYWGVARFISRTRKPDNDRWFCAELTDASIRRGDVRLLERIESDEISPNHQRLSPLIIPEPLP